MTTAPAAAGPGDPLQQWRVYADCWALEGATLAAELARLVSAEVVYRDPMSEVDGLEAFGAYMRGFAVAYPGHRFEIDTVDLHHGRSLACWRQVDAAGELVLRGTSFAVHDDAGLLADITGYFPAP